MTVRLGNWGHEGPEGSLGCEKEPFPRAARGTGSVHGLWGRLSLGVLGLGPLFSCESESFLTRETALLLLTSPVITRTF